MQRIWAAGVFFVFDGPIVYDAGRGHDDHIWYVDVLHSRNDVDDSCRFP